MDLSTIEGLTDEQKSQIGKAHDEDVIGLKNKRDELLSKISESKGAVSEQEQKLEEARQAAVKADEARLKAEGKFDEAQKLGEEERSRLVAEANSKAEQANTLLKQRDLKDVHFDILGKVHDNFTPAAKAMLNADTDVTYGEDGKPIISIRSGGKEFNSTTDFLKHAETDPTWSAMLKAPDTQGTGANGSQGGQASSDRNDPDAAYKQRLRESGLTS
jgi:hypothetical protein